MRLTPDLILAAYSQGFFPMADSAHGNEIHWYRPGMRAIIPIETFHIGRTLQKTLRRNEYSIKTNHDFAAVIDRCAASAPGRENTWINKEIRDVFIELHALGHAHSIETYETGKNNTLVGGVYGLAIGGAFFGESMFSLKPNASKVALAHLMQSLKQKGFVLFDAQFMNPHLTQFGAHEIPHEEYSKLLRGAIRNDVSGV